MANILVTGSKGQLGSELQKIGFTLLDDVFYTDLPELDITDEQAVGKFVREKEIDTIINCAAYTAVDKAEEEKEKAALINTAAVANLAKVAAAENCLLIHISTDYVFDGTATVPYTEKDRPHPQSVYGMTKWEGERAIQKSGCLAIILRTAWLYAAEGNNFVKTILRLAAEKGEIHVVADQTGTPTYAADLARVIVKIVTDNELGDNVEIYHYTNEGVCSWYEFAREIVKQSGIKCEVYPLTTAQYPTKARRPAYSVLDKSKLKQRYGIEIPVWQEALGRCLAAMSDTEKG